MVMMSKDQCVADIGHRLIEVRKGKAVRWREGFVKLDKPVLLVFLLTFLSELSMLGCWSATREAEYGDE